MQTKSKPAHQITVGSIRAAIWKHPSQGIVHYDTIFSRLYKDGEIWKSAASFGRDDLLLLAKVADQVHSWIHAQPKEEKP